jgi:aryl-alcohol dehydrogenase
MLNVLKPKEGQVVAVVGAGAVGLSAIMAIKLASSKPSKIIAVDIVPARLEMAKKYGATHFINSKETPDLKSALLEITGGEGVDGSIDTSGRPDVVNTLLDACARKGIVVSVGVGRVSPLLVLSQALG